MNCSEHFHAIIKKIVNTNANTPPIQISISSLLPSLLEYEWSLISVHTQFLKIAGRDLPLQQLITLDLNSCVTLSVGVVMTRMISGIVP